jgi:hypothetical protein
VTGWIPGLPGPDSRALYVGHDSLHTSTFTLDFQVTFIRMSGTTTSEAARTLVQRRWGAQRPIRLAHELVERANELPSAERLALLVAL